MLGEVRQPTRAPMSTEPSALTSTPATTARRGAVIGAVVSAFAASACCLGPALLALVGLSGAGVGAALEAYRPLFLAATVGLLGAGFYLTYRRPRAAAACAVEGCERPRAARAGRVLLWIATVAVVVFTTYPYVAGALATTSRAGTATAGATTATARLHIDGMDCEACASAITRDLAAAPGVVRAQVVYAQRLALVSYDPAQVGRARLVEIITALGYRARALDVAPGRSP